ncbi:Uncharacterised protein [Leminorella grimontii]|nr:Uncharacterised protein [Leminorella grimontii]
MQALLFLLRGEHHDHLASFNPTWIGFNNGQFCKIVTNAVKHFHADLLVSHFTTAEAERNLGFITLFQKANQAAEFYLIVAIIGTRSEFDFLDLNNFLFLLLLFRSLALFIEELAVVHNPANGRLSIRADLNQIDTRFLCFLQRFIQTNNPYLLAVYTCQSNFTGANLCVYAIRTRCLNSFSAFNTLFLQLVKTTTANFLLQFFNNVINVKATQILAAAGANGNFAGLHLFIAAN